MRKLTGQLWLIRYRRMFGLFAFFYAMLHFLTFIWLDKSFDLHEIWADVLKRRFITVGFTAFVLLIPLALTSTQGWIRRLGGKRWQTLHRLIYVSAIAGVTHYWWLVKADINKPAEYALVPLSLARVSACGMGQAKELETKSSSSPREARKATRDRSLFALDVPLMSAYKSAQATDNFLGRIVFKVSGPFFPPSKE